MSVAPTVTRHKSQVSCLGELARCRKAIELLPEWAEIEFIHFPKDQGATIRLTRESFLRFCSGETVDVEPQNKGDDLIWKPLGVAQIEATYSETGHPRQKEITLPEWSEL